MAPEHIRACRLAKSMGSKVPAHKSAMPSIVVDNNLARLHYAPTGAQRYAAATDDVSYFGNVGALAGVDSAAAAFLLGWKFVHRGRA